jgi:hypothetical protein
MRSREWGALMAGQQIDRDKLRAALRKLRPEDLFHMLEEAITLLPQEQLLGLAKPHLNVSTLMEDGKPKDDLLTEVKAFEKRSLDGDYFEPFDVNWKNCSAQSMGTTAWIAEYGRFLKRCVAEEKLGDPAAVRESFDILFGLVDLIDEGSDEVLFFADDGGSWEFGEDWHEVLPPWFRVLAATSAPEEFAERVLAILKARCAFGSDKMLAAAHKTATPEQAKALVAREKAQPEISDR